jgi:3'(2'), 5'-bisphosphate nucleotidase
MIQTLVTIAQQAGTAIMEVYSQEFAVEEKADKSPVTEADLAANTIILTQLSAFFPDIPVLSEEGAKIPWETRKTWKRLFLVDPLDGTKDFVKKNGEFTVNVAYVEDGQTKQGVVYAPASERLFYSDGQKSIFNDQEIYVRTPGAQLTVIASRSHFNEETKSFIEHYGKPYTMMNIGSSLKFCQVAMGKADLYPRCAPTMEWDSAAAHAVLKTAGGNVVDFHSGKELTYNKEDLHNPWFIASGKK